MMEWPGPESFVPYYDPEGNATWEYRVGTGWETFNLFFNGKHAAINNAAEGLRWRHLDHLGNLVLKTNNAGVDVCRYYYKPYGEISSLTCTEGDDYWFTGKERDGETGLDYFGARYHGSAIGRFTSPDESLVDQFPEDPQSWNLFSYVPNNPLTSVDPAGKERVKLDDGNSGDDGQGEVCASAGLDQEIAASATVVEYGPMPLNTSRRQEKGSMPASEGGRKKSRSGSTQPYAYRKDSTPESVRSLEQGRLRRWNL